LDYDILLIGTIDIFVAYPLSRSDLYYSARKDKIGSFGSIGIISKIYQTGNIVVSHGPFIQTEKKKQ
jgi:hypothetical protein